MESKNNSFFLYLLPTLLLFATVWVLWPYYQYYVDPDAIGYLNITQKYIDGDYQHAINAFWSPMGCWLTALLVKATNWPIFASAIIVNVIPSAGAVIGSIHLFRKFNTDTFENWAFAISNSLFWSYTVYFQSFTDNWQFFFLIWILNVTLSNNFVNQPLKWIFTGLLAALSYFGKAYSFVFFPVMITVITWVLLKKQDSFSLKKLMFVALLAVATMILCSFPWIYILHDKYGIWTSSTAGTLNMSWWLVGTQEFKDGIDVLAPPPYQGSLFYFEDPWMAQRDLPRFWHSPQLFIKQLLRIGFNILGWVESCNRISAAYFLVWLITILMILKKGIFQTTDSKLSIVALIFIIFPLPFWMLTFNGGRYLWITISLMCILGMHFARKALYPYLSKNLQRIFAFAFFISIVITPVVDLKSIFNAGKEEYQMAEQLKALNIKGAFVSNWSYEDASEFIIRLSWFSQNPWYCQPLNNFSTKMLLQDAKRYPIKYYFYFYKGSGDDYEFRDLNNEAKEDLTKGTIPGLKVFQIGL